MKKVDLSKFSLPELIQIKKDLPRAISNARKNEKKNVRKKIEALAAESGFDLEEIITNKKKQKRAKAKPKYRNPKNSKQTWTGRGRTPLWVQDYLASGGKKEDLLIKS